MTKFKTVFKKTWVFATAIALIVGSNSVMASTLSPNVASNPVSNVVPVTDAVKEDIQNKTTQKEAVSEYAVIDGSKNTQAEKEQLKERIIYKLSHDGVAPDQIEEKANTILAAGLVALTPGEKDITAAQAASYASYVLKKAYGVDFKDYTVKASFFSTPLPNDSAWTVTFTAPGEVLQSDQSEAQNPIAKSYVATVNSMNGTMINASFFDRDTTRINKNLNDPAWKEKAAQSISALLLENVTLINSKVVFATPETGVTVVCEMSDGSAYAVRLIGENKEAAAFLFFPNGYDGSLDKRF